MTTATLMAGIPAENKAFYHEIRFAVGDPTALITIENGGSPKRTLIIRDIEMHRAKQHAKADQICCPADFEPSGGLSSDRETATAQAIAECLKQSGVDRVTADRSLPLIYAHHIRSTGIEIDCDPALGIMGRRAKDAQEIEALRQAQSMTEKAMRMACEMVGQAQAGSDGGLMLDNSPLTSERVLAAIDIFLLERGYTTPGSIVAGGSDGVDCHNRGSGQLQTGTPVIIDIFPCSRETMYNGDCTRTVVHGEINPQFAKMHAAVVEAKAASIAATRAGVTADAVYQTAIDVIKQHGWDRALLPDNAPADFCSMQHGLGHGIGLDVHEPPLIDVGGPELVIGDALTIEPGLYHVTLGGIRIEDMVIVTQNGCDNLNSLPEGLTWA